MSIKGDDVAVFRSMEKIELAALRIAHNYRLAGTHDDDLIADAFQMFADQIASLKPKDTP